MSSSHLKFHSAANASLRYQGGLFLLTIFLAGCNRYAEASPTCSQITVALFSVCNLRDEARLTTVAEQIAQASKAGQLTEREANWLNSIVESARSGDWETAGAEARSLLDAQVD